MMETPQQPSETKFFTTNDNVKLAYKAIGSPKLPPLILLHGFTGSSEVWRRNIATLSQSYNLFIPDLRGHGDSDKPAWGFQVSRLAMDFHSLLEHLDLSARKGLGEPESLRHTVRCIAGSLGCSILWCYFSLFGTSSSFIFSHIIFVDQAPMQNYSLLSSSQDPLYGGWDAGKGNRGMHDEAAVRGLQEQLAIDPDVAYRGTVAACLGYRAFPRDTDLVTAQEAEDDETFFVNVAKLGNAAWYGQLMADHTALDWRESIKHTMGSGSGWSTKVLVVASSRSGCFPAEGPLEVVKLCNQGRLKGEEIAEGLVLDWGGHWCYWEDPGRFEKLTLDFLCSITEA